MKMCPQRTSYTELYVLISIKYTPPQESAAS